MEGGTQHLIQDYCSPNVAAGECYRVNFAGRWLDPLMAASLHAVCLSKVTSEHAGKCGCIIENIDFEKDTIVVSTLCIYVVM